MKALAAVLVLAATLAATSTASAYQTRPGTIWTIGGNGTSCSAPTGPCGDGGSALAASLGLPRGIAIDPGGNVYVVDTSSQKIRRITPAGAISTVAGTGAGCAQPTAPCGDGGPATAAQMNNPAQAAFDAAGNLYFADQNLDRIRKIATDGTISTVAGDGQQCFPSTDPCGDGGAATAAHLRAPTAVAVDGSGDLYIADQFDHRIRKVSGGIITTFAGDGTACSTASCGDGGAPTSAQLNFPLGVAVDSAGHVYIADTGDQKIRKVAGGVITTVAGDGTACATPTSACGDGGSPTAAQLNFPSSVAVDGAGSVYVGDRTNNKVRILTAGAIFTLAGTGNACAFTPFCGDGGAARDADLNSPFQVAVDPAGANIFIADANDRLVRWIAGPQAGPAGPQGPTGGTGAPGSTGAPGPQGEPGKNARVTCKVGKVKRRRVRVTCRVRLVRATASTPVRARLSRNGKTYALGRGTTSARRTSLRMRRIRRITRGTYTLSTRVKGRAGVTRRRVVMR
jgi:sugar lactone lactonase YvrE